MRSPAHLTKHKKQVTKKHGFACPMTPFIHAIFTSMASHILLRTNNTRTNAHTKGNDKIIQKVGLTAPPLPPAVPSTGVPFWKLFCLMGFAWRIGLCARLQANKKTPVKRDTNNYCKQVLTTVHLVFRHHMISQPKTPVASNMIARSASPGIAVIYPPFQISHVHPCLAWFFKALRGLRACDMSSPLNTWENKDLYGELVLTPSHLLVRRQASRAHDMRSQINTWENRNLYRGLV
jgi:hypothetical protein